MSAFRFYNYAKTFYKTKKKQTNKKIKKKKKRENFFVSTSRVKIWMTPFGCIFSTWKLSDNKQWSDICFCDTEYITVY